MKVKLEREGASCLESAAARSEIRARATRAARISGDHNRLHSIGGNGSWTRNTPGARAGTRSVAMRLMKSELTDCAASAATIGRLSGESRRSPRSARPQNAQKAAYQTATTPQTQTKDPVAEIDHQSRVEGRGTPQAEHLHAGRRRRARRRYQQQSRDYLALKRASTAAAREALKTPQMADSSMEQRQGRGSGCSAMALPAIPLAPSRKKRLGWWACSRILGLAVGAPHH